MSQSVLGLDVGSKRIGVAAGNTLIGIARPLTTITNDETCHEQIMALLAEHDVAQLVIGLPRGLDGQETTQTTFARDFAAQIQAITDVPVRLQDEALTSVQAEAELKARGKQYTKGEIDALAATYILQDYLDAERSST